MSKIVSFSLWSTLLGLLAVSTAAVAQDWPDRRVLPIQPYQQIGRIEPTIRDSGPVAWPRTVEAPEGAPNVLLITYYTPGTAHAPHHAPADWIARFKGKFDHGRHKQREMTFARPKELTVKLDAQSTK